MLSPYLNADDDWIEKIRKWFYPRLHPYLKKVGGYGIGGVYENQYVGTIQLSEDEFEEKLVDLGFVRNPIASYKRHGDGRESEGSWVLYHDEAPELVAEEMQLHITLFSSDDGIDIYAHYEDDWRYAPGAHLAEKNLSVKQGVEKASEILKPLLWESQGQSTE